MSWPCHGRHSFYWRCWLHHRRTSVMDSNSGSPLATSGTSGGSRTAQRESIVRVAAATTARTNVQFPLLVRKSRSLVVNRLTLELLSRNLVLLWWVLRKPQQPGLLPRLRTLLQRCSRTCTVLWSRRQGSQTVRRSLRQLQFVVRNGSWLLFTSRTSANAPFK